MTSTQPSPKRHASNTAITTATTATATATAAQQQQEEQNGTSRAATVDDVQADQRLAVPVAVVSSVITSPSTSSSSISSQRSSTSTSSKHRSGLQLFVCRHAERVDNTFGDDWLKYSFSHYETHDVYRRFDLNMPKD